MITRTRAEFYQSPRWKSVRASALRRDGYMDMVKHRYGKRIEAELVHHVFPLDEFPEYGLKLWNLVSVSRATHNQLHDRDTGELTEAGADLLRRVAKKYNVEIPEKYRETRKESIPPRSRR